MTDTTSKPEALESFRAEVEHTPSSDEEMEARALFYAALMTRTIAAALETTIKEIRKSAATLPEERLRQVAQKEYDPVQLISANKEISLCWLQQDAQEQGGKEMPPWLGEFFTKVAAAIENRYPFPAYKDILPEYWFCLTKDTFCWEAADLALQALGFGDARKAFVEKIEQGVVRSQAREHMLEKALTLPIEAIREQSLW